MALKCYPLQPGGLLAIEAIIIGMTNPAHVKAEIMSNFEVILLLMFMVAGIYFMKQLLLFVFTRLLIAIESKITLSLSFVLVQHFIRVLDALTVVAVIISVAMGFYGVYHKVASGNKLNDLIDITNDDKLGDKRATLEQFRAF
ncbi:sodium/proton antiporter [Rodentibacter pneumotropicus]|uniref:Sodium/proton antiporter n=1 Tax=Rodentibacter pneumotropicus TaxID=758 RepID=A0A3S4TXN1_9PAST|nr:sodium/proton antiporter [Rodentibacter pneumotropicus]